MKKTILSLMASSFLLTACETGWLGEDEAPPLEGERISLFDDRSLSSVGTPQAVDVTANLRDEIPMRDVTAEEARAIAQTEAALREMEAEIKNEIAQTSRIVEDVEEEIETIETANAPTDILDKPSDAEVALQKALAQEAAEKQAGQEALAKAQSNLAQASVLSGFIQPPVWRNEFWPQAGGYSNHAMQHLALNSGALKKIWSSSVGRGSTKETPLTAQPIVVDGKVFTLDTRLNVKAMDIDRGRKIWETNIMKPSEDDPVIAGGLAFSGGRIFATNGFNEVVALSPFDGRILWRRNLSSPARSAPSAIDGRVFVKTLDNQLVALNAEDGAVLWSHSGLQSETGLLGAASPAVTRDIVVPTYSSGEVYALRVENGSAAWADSLTPARRTGAGAVVTDIRALPIIDKGLIVTMSFADKMVAIDERTGARRWERSIGGAQTPWVAGNRIFVVDRNMKLMALSRDTGQTVWSAQLQEFKDPEDREGPIKWYGPIFAGERLLAFSSTGHAIEVDPVSGAMKRTWKTGVNLVKAPVIAGGRLYLLSENGTLSVWE